ncbi:MAG: polysaccharide deacetylase family protein [Chloroflexota bacterium]|nr:polysaccharide deacetylase family protein [Chloroflexota bacterium]
MHRNPALIELGFSPQDRVVIIHADDLGMCHAANAAFADLVSFGLVTCGSAMVPCPWFPELAAYGRQHPEADIGVHLTLNSEHPSYRWPPISTRDPASGLLDEEGYLPRTVRALHGQVSPEAALAEIRAQVVRALAAGIDVTHVDTHMAAVIHPQVFSGYLNLAMERRLPGLFPRLTPELAQRLALPTHTTAVFGEELDRLEAMGLPLIDHVASVSLGPAEDPLGAYQRACEALQPGLTHLIIHPALPGSEIEAIIRDAWQRIADYQAMMSQELRSHLAAAGVHVLGYRELRDVMRTAMGQPPGPGTSDGLSAT